MRSRISSKLISASFCVMLRFARAYVLRYYARVSYGLVQDGQLCTRTRKVQSEACRNPISASCLCVMHASTARSTGLHKASCRMLHTLRTKETRIPKLQKTNARTDHERGGSVLRPRRGESSTFRHAESFDALSSSSSDNETRTTLPSLWAEV